VCQAFIQQTNHGLRLKNSRHWTHMRLVCSADDVTVRSHIETLNFKGIAIKNKGTADLLSSD